VTRLFAASQVTDSTVEFDLVDPVHHGATDSLRSIEGLGFPEETVNF